jgi:hypothetical protein
MSKIFGFSFIFFKKSKVSIIESDQITEANVKIICDSEGKGLI